MLDKEAQSGTIDVKVDAASIDFGNDKLNEHAKGPDLFDTAKFPQATYTGKLTGFQERRTHRGRRHAATARRVQAGQAEDQQVPVQAAIR